MRYLISGVVAAVAVVAASPAMACGYSSCGTPCGYYNPCAQPRFVAPVATYGYGYGTGCNTGCGWTTERLAEPTTQYYHVNQGPTYSGPGNWAPAPTYSEEAPVSGWSHYSQPYGHGYAARPRVWAPRAYGYRPYGTYRHAYAHRYHGMYHGAPYPYGPRVLRRYY